MATPLPSRYGLLTHPQIFLNLPEAKLFAAAHKKQLEIPIQLSYLLHRSIEGAERGRPD
jgi:hypothetical protein